MDLSNITAAPRQDPVCRYILPRLHGSPPTGKKQGRLDIGFIKMGVWYCIKTWVKKAVKKNIILN